MAEGEKIKIADRRTSTMADEPQESCVQSNQPKDASSASFRQKQVSQNQEKKLNGYDEKNDLETDFDEEAVNKRGIALQSLSVPDLANFIVGLLLQKSYICLGVIPDPETGKTKRNFSEARLAIDLVSAIANEMTGKWGNIAFEKELQTQLTNLRLQFARVIPKTSE